APAVIPALMAALCGPAPQSLRAICFVAGLGPAAGPVLTSLLHLVSSADPRTRAVAIAALAELGRDDARVLAVLREAARRHPDERAARLALFRLGRPVAGVQPATP